MTEPQWSPSKHGWDRYAVGDTRIYPYPPDKDPLIWRASMGALARLYARRHGWRFRVVKARDGVQVTRTS